MSDYLEIDLKRIVKNILKNWYWVVVPGLILGVSVFIFFDLQTDLYRTQAQFALTDPPYLIQFDERYTTLLQEQPPEIAIKGTVMNNEITTALFGLYECPEVQAGGCSYFQFREKVLNVELSENGMFVALIVQTESRENAALLANTWVELAMAAVNNTYFGLESGSVPLLQSQAALAQTEVEKAGEKLVSFASENSLAFLRNELNDLLANQVQIQHGIRSLEKAKRDIQSLMGQLEFESQESLIDSNIRLSYALIQAGIINQPVIMGIGGSEIHGDYLLESPLETWTVSPSQLLIEVGSELESKTVGGFTTLLENWLIVIDETILQLNGSKDSIVENVNNLEGQIQSLENKAALLEADYSRQQTIYEIMTTMYEGNRFLNLRGEEGYVKLVSSAPVPNPGDIVPHTTVRNTAIGLLTGAFVGLAGVVVADWWKSSNNLEEPELP